MKLLFSNKRIFLLLLIPLFYYSCGKHVPNVPIYVNMNGFEHEEYADYFEDKLVTKLKRLGFQINNDTTSPYQLLINDFYYYNYNFTVSAPYDDCNSFDYTLTAYRYGIEAELLYKNKEQLKTWSSSRSKEDELKEDDTYSNCSSYRVSRPTLEGGAFFRQRAIDIAKGSSRIVAKDY